MKTTTVHALFSAQANTTPHAQAVVCDGVCVSYAELDARANQIARVLAALGVRPEERVGVLCQRSTETLACMLAVLKLGAAYMPLEPSYPGAQIAAMLETGAPQLVVEDGSVRKESLVGAVGTCRTVTQLELLQLAASESTDALACQGDGESIAYVMFTSGSQGRPKAVSVRHQGIVRLVRDANYVRLGSEQVLLHMAPLAFDASTFEVWGALLNGGSVAVLQAAQPSFSQIGDCIHQAGVTTAWLTAGLFHAIVDHRVELLAPLQQLLTGGDVVSAAHVQRAYAALPDCQIINGYGPTENTTFTCCYPIPRSGWTGESLPIGDAIRGTTVYVVDEQLRPVADGEAGQLVTGGLGVAAGYLGDPSRTAQVFVEDPWSTQGGMLYCTGDRVRRRADGLLEFLGRNDRQVKINGKRVELDEVETALRALPGVGDAVAVVREDTPGLRRLVGYIAVKEPDARHAVADWRVALGVRLPQHMVPAVLVPMDELPLTPQGKLDRKRLPMPEVPDGSGSARAGTLQAVARVWSDVLGLAQVDDNANFFELGGTSLQLIVIHERLSKLWPTCKITDLFQHASIKSLARFLDDGGRAPGSPSDVEESSARRAAQGAAGEAEPGFAIVGMAGRFPGAGDLGEFFRNVCAGVDSIEHFAEHELEDAFPDEIRRGSNFVRARSTLPGVDLFDYRFFGMTPREAGLTDPQQRIFLECCYEALEDAGYDPAGYAGKVGVFGGSSISTYLLKHVLNDRAAVERFTSEYQVGMYSELLGALTDTLATRVAYKLGLRGPAATVHTACSTSLYAVTQACESLQSGQCDMALAGGVSITFPQNRGYQYLEGGIVSADGKCRPFDAQGSGTVFGSGAGVVILKRLAAAQADGDHIYAVVRGYGVNNDGAAKAGFTAPSTAAQAEAIAMAHASAGIEPGTIGYVEAHGTATPLGDPIEFAGLRKAFGADAGAGGRCALGSVKANIGHLDAAAGVVGLIKSALCLQHKTIPPLVNYRAPNPHIDLDHSPFYVPTVRQSWEAKGEPRRAGVSAFGVGGTNVHVVLEEAPPAQVRAVSQHEALPQLLVTAARSRAGVQAQWDALVEHCQAHAELSLADAAHTLQQGRRAFEHRIAGVAASTQQVVDLRSGSLSKGCAMDSRGVVFLFPGQGSQFAGMARRLYDLLVDFRAEVDRAAELLKPRLELDLRDLLLDASAAAPERLQETYLAQPALFVVSHGLAKVWQRFGVRPAACVGHSVGELAAAAFAGALPYDATLAFVAERGRLMQGLPKGSMLAVRMTEAELRGELPAGLDMAAINGPQACVVAGPTDAIEAYASQLQARDVAHRVLRTSHAFHSSMMDGALDALAHAARDLVGRPPEIPLVSGVTGQLSGVQTLADPTYWSRHCREPVRFADALRTAVGGLSQPALLEVGPGRALSAMARTVVAAGDVAATTPSFQEGTDAWRGMLEAAGALWCQGINLRWQEIPGAGVHKVSLPTYRFERSSCWAVGSSGAQDMTTRTEGSVRMTAPLNEPNLEIVSMPQSSEPAQRTGRIATELLQILASVSGSVLTAEDSDVSFLELGFDSLTLGQVASRIQQKLKVKVSFRDLMGSYPSCQALAEHLDGLLPADQFAEPAPAGGGQNGLAQPQVPMPAQTPPPAPAMATPGAGFVGTAPVAGGAGGEGLMGLFQSQLRTMQELIAQQNALLAGAHPMAMVGSAGPAGVATNGVIPNGAAAAAPAVPQVSAPVATPVSTAQPAAKGVAEMSGRARRFDPSAPRSDGSLSAAQQALVDDLVRRSSAKMGNSRAQTAKDRPYLADPRAVSGFRPETKELCYPLVVERSKGAYLWDADGHRYVDLVNGYGQTLFGHAPDFVLEAVKRQLEVGFAIGPQTPLAGQVAAQFCEMTNNERVTFCNTGSEAVMAAMRVARCVSGRDKVVVFANDYHGQFDEVLVRGTGRIERAGALPLAPGIPFDSVSNMVVLPYGTEESLAYITEHAEDLAAVIVEPVQSRHPELRPLEFLRALREVTTAAETALVFDEVVTGFRVHPGGMQAVFGIHADMATYGKVLGGGLPIGVLAGDAKYLDALDGGQWQFGDNSLPEVAPTFFAGTFVRHPVVLAACQAVLDHLRTAGPSLQSQLAARNGALVDRINADFARKGMPAVERYSSWFMPRLSDGDRLGSLFYYTLRADGIHIQDGFPCFLTTSHTDEDLERIGDVFSSALDSLQRSGVLVPAGGMPEEAPTEPAPAASVTPSDPVVPPLRVEPAEPFEIPLSEPQLEVLMAAQLGDEASCCFNESIRVELSGPLDVQGLAGTLNRLVERHEALRSTVVDGEPRLRVAPEGTWPLAMELADGAGDPELQLAALLADEASTAFDLVAGPLVRARLLTLAHNQHVLVLTMHHIVCDGWSIGVLVDEFIRCYQAASVGTAPELEPVLPLTEYIKQTEQPEGDAAAAERFWLGKFSSLPSPVDLPLDRPRPTERSFAGATYTTFVEASLAQALKKASGKQGCTLFTALFAAMQVVVSRVANSTDVVIACPFAGQSTVQEGSLVGHCVNLLPLRCPIEAQGSIGEHLGRAHRAILEALEHQSYTMGTLVRRLALPREANRLPLTSLQFNLDRGQEPVEFMGVKAAVLPNPKAFSNFDMFWNVTESSSGLRIDCDYNTEVFDEATVGRWLGYYQEVLRAIVEVSESACATVPMMPAGEVAWLVDELNATAKDCPASLRAADLFEQCADKEPEAVAVVAADAQLTYGDLDRRANQLANVLRRVAPEPGSRVVVATERTANAVVAMLAVMKAGRVYVPVDVEYPEARIHTICKLASAAAVICDSQAGQELAPKGVATVRVDSQATFQDVAATRSQEPAERAVGEAYIIFTSGSTGEPKGVEVGHAALTNCLTSMAAQPGFGPFDRLLAVTTVTFDISLVELWLPLVVGGSVVVATRDEVREGTALVEHFQLDELITHIQATPTLWRILLEAGFQGRPGLTIISGGEPLTRDLADRLLQTCGRLVNAYGPTEATIWASCCDVGQTGPVHVGQPFNNTQLYVLDALQQPCPVGVVGELYIGGVCLANRYVGQPELTERAFVTARIRAGASAQRLYRTGDLAKRLPDGTLQVLGRRDQQVKVRGFRVELEEIETAIRRVPGVQDAAVVLKSTGEGEGRLVGYIVAREPDLAPDIEKLYMTLSERLPGYMIPVAWVFMDAFPTTANGKLNRAGLPDPLQSAAAAVAPAENAAPQTPLEGKLLEVWRDVLSGKEFGIHDRLLFLGADSLQVFRIVARLKERGIAVRARDLMRNPSISQLAKQIESGGVAADAPNPKVVPALESFRRPRRESRGVS